MHELSKLCIIFHIAASVILYYETNPYENFAHKMKVYILVDDLIT